MPIYEYQCIKCESEFEYLIEGGAKASCPKCESKKVERLLSVISSPQASSGSQACGPPMPGGGCALPQCGSSGIGGGGG